MTEIESIHRLAYRLEKSYGIGNDNITVKTIHKVVDKDPSFPDINGQAYLNSLKRNDIIVKTSDSQTAVDRDKYSLVPGWDAGIPSKDIKASIIKNTPDSEAKQSGFAEF